VSIGIITSEGFSSITAGLDGSGAGTFTTVGFISNTPATPGIGPRGGPGGGPGGGVPGGGGAAGASCLPFLGTSAVQQESRHSGAQPCGQEAGQRPPDAACAAAAAFPVRAERGIDISGSGAGASPGFCAEYCAEGRGIMTVPAGFLDWS
jgi:hypothetical protein